MILEIPSIVLQNFSTLVYIITSIHKDFEIHMILEISSDVRT